MRIRGLWKLPDGWDWLWRELGLALVGKAMLSKPNCLLMGGTVLPPCKLFGLSQPVLEYRHFGRAKGKLQKYLWKHLSILLCLPGLLLPVPHFPWQATSEPRLHRRPSNTHRQVWLSLFVGSLVLSSGAWCTKYGEKVETVADFIYLGSKITADTACCHKIKRCLLLGRKVMTNVAL